MDLISNPPTPERKMKEPEGTVIQTLPPTKMWFINRTKKAVGSFMPLRIEIISGGEGKNDRVSIVYESTKGFIKDKVDYYGEESEWLEEVKLM